MFCPRTGLSLKTQHFPLYPLLSLPFRMFIQSIYHNVVYHLISFSAVNFLPVYIPSRTFFCRQFLLSQWPGQFLLLIFNSLLLPLFLAQLHFLFCLSILHSPSFSISTPQMLPVAFANSVVMSKSLYHTTLHSTKGTLLASSLVFSQGSAENASLPDKSFFCHCYMRGSQP